MSSVHHHLGAIGETKVTLDLMELGFYVYLPSHEGGPIDLIAFRGANIYRVQAKYRSLINGFVTIHWESGEDGYSDTCDIIAVYVPELEKVFYIPSGICRGNKAKKRLHLREKDKDQINYLYRYIEFPYNNGLTATPIVSGQKQFLPK